MSDGGQMDLDGIEPGEVRVQTWMDRRRQEWLLVAVGRRSYVKRFNLRPEEAAKLVELLVKNGS